jgi:ABC-type antimicrobial peptide transport system permease subunit
LDGDGIKEKYLIDYHWKTRKICRIERYPIRTSIDWWIFPLTGFMALAFALVIVSTQALRASGANPVKSLRSE